MKFLVFFGKHTERNVSFLGPLFESDNLRRLAGVTSFLLDLIRGGGGTVHGPRSAEVPHFFKMYLIRGLYIYIYIYIFLLISIGSKRLSQYRFRSELVLLGAQASCTEVRKERWNVRFQGSWVIEPLDTLAYTLLPKMELRWLWAKAFVAPLHAN